MKPIIATIAVLLSLVGAACTTSRPVWSATPSDKAAAGTIGGSLKKLGGEPVAGRHVDVVALDTSQKYTAVTNITGGFSIEVPPGKYRLQPELHDGETVIRDPGVVDIKKSDLDANREIVIKP